MAPGADLRETQVAKPAHLKLEMPMQSPSKRRQPLDQKGEEKQPTECEENSGRRSKSSPMDKGRV